MSQIILASGSPRRKELLEQMGLTFEVCPAKREEVITTDIPKDVVVELASQKAREVASGMLDWMTRGCPFPGTAGGNFGETQAEGAGETAGKIDGENGFLCEPDDIMVIGADTVVSCDNRILGKPKDDKDAVRMLTLLSGRIHEVYTGVSVVFIDKSGRCGEHSFFEKTSVTMCEMSPEEIARYVASGDPLDKAGAYGIQGKCAIYIQKIDGDYNNVVGLPIGRLYQELKRLGIDIYLW